MSLVPVSASGLAAAFRGLSTSDFASVGADACAQATINVNIDTLSGDVMIASPNAGDLGVDLALFPAFCGLGSGNVVLCNASGGALDAVSQEFNWSIIRTSFNLPASGIVCFDRRSVTVDIAAIADAATTMVAVPIPGAELGDTVCLAAPSGFPADLIIGVAGVFPAGTAVVPFCNPTAAPIDPGSLTYTAIVLKAGQRQSPYGRRACVRGSLPAFNPPSSAANAVTNWSVPIVDAKVGDVGFIVTQLATGLGMGMGRCDVAGTLIVPAVNPTAAPIDPAVAVHSFVLFR